jgi:hypothetical protein
MKFAATGIRLIVLLAFVYFIQNTFRGTLSEAIPYLRKAGVNKVTPEQPITPEKSIQFNHALDITTSVDEIFFILFLLFLLICIVVIVLYLVNRDKTDHPIGNFLNQKRKFVFRALIAGVLFFLFASLVIPLYPLKVQNDLFLESLTSLREQSPNSAVVDTPPAIIADNDFSATSEKLRIQIGDCWDIPKNVPTGQQMPVEVLISINRDHTIHDAHIVDQERLKVDQNFQLMANAALNALKKPACSHLDLPDEKYEEWKDIDFTFDPSDPPR